MQKLNIIKVGGAILEDAQSFEGFLKNFASVPGLKVLVHGGGRSATKIAASLGIESKMAGGRRITDAPMLDVVTMVYGGLVNKKVVAALQALGMNALGLTGADLGYMLSVKRPVGEIDYGFAGDVVNTDASILADLIGKGVVPVLAPLTHDGKGQLLNTNADTIAAEAATALSANFETTLTYCFEKPGVLRDPDDDTSVIPLITRQQFHEYVESGVISGGMIPKIQNAFNSLERGVTKVVITKADNLGKKGGTVIVEL